MPDEQDKDAIIAHLRAEIARKDQQLELLTQKVDALVKRIFGSSAEKIDINQLLLFEDPKKPEGDGYQAYESYRKQRNDIELIGCWANVRRKFYEAKDQKPKLTGWFLRQIQNLYQIEAQLR